MYYCIFSLELFEESYILQTCNHHLLVLLKFYICLFKVIQPGNSPVIAVLAEKHVVDHVYKFVLNVGISEPVSWCSFI
jgi:uncharacterized membrane protein